jgi:hypothetical protein
MKIVSFQRSTEARESGGGADRDVINAYRRVPDSVVRKFRSVKCSYKEINLI